MSDQQPEVVLDHAETLLAHLICADNDDAKNNVTGAKRGVSLEEVDAGAILRFDVMRPKLAYTFDMLDEDRLFTADHKQLISSAPDVLGDESEVAILKEGGYVQWSGYRRVKKVPRGIWVGGKIGALYEVHWRQIYQTGKSSYFRRMAAVAPDGRPLQCLIVGSRNPGARDLSLILAASIIEDAHRSGCFTTTVQDSAGVAFPVPYGAQTELFKLRDAPLNHSGRRKAILHWVARHIRRRGGKQTEVSSHTRGVHEIVMDGFRIHLDPNDN